MKVPLAHTPEFRRQYRGEHALKALQALTEVKLNEANDALDAAVSSRLGGSADIMPD